VMKRYTGLFLPSLLAVSMIFTEDVRAAAGSLDPTFGTEGVATASFNSTFLVGDVIEQPDGKILVSNSYFPFQVARFEANGSLDTNFGDGGSTNPFAPSNQPASSAGAMAVLPDGRILVGTAVPCGAALVRLNPNGSLDSSFGSSGIASVCAPAGFGLSGGPFLVQPDGKILLGGTASQVNYRSSIFQTFLARFNADGSLDNTFGTNGSINVKGSQGVSAMALLTTGDILTLNSSAIAQFSSTGAQRASATSGPIAVTAASSFLRERIEPNGEYVLGVTVNEGIGRCHDYDSRVIRFIATGSVDTTFNRPSFDFVGEGGCSNSDVAGAIDIEADGKVVLAGRQGQTTANSATNVLVRLNTDGSFDSGFGSGGFVFNNQPAGANGYSAVLVQNDGKILAVGTGLSGQNNSLVYLARYLAK